MRFGLLLMGLAACTRVVTQECPPAPVVHAPVDASNLVPPPTWPALPKTSAEADALLAKSRTRPLEAAPHVDDYDIDFASTGLVDARAGEQDIAAALTAWLAVEPKQGAYLIFGGTHDSAAQLDLVARIVSRTKGLWGVAFEQLHAAGAWSGTPAPRDTDDADLARLVARQDEALDSLRDRQARLDYAAWKFGYVSRVIDAVLMTRNAGIAPIACDMPPDVRDALPKDLSEDRLLALRDLHFVLSAQTRLAALTGDHLPENFDPEDPPPSPRAAFFVGENHAYKTGLESFLPPKARALSIVLVGGREEGFDTSRPKLRAIDPLLLKLTGDVSMLILPEPKSPVSRVKDHGVPVPPSAPGSPAPSNLFVSSDAPITFELPRIKLAVDRRVESASVRASDHVFALRTGTVSWMGQLHVPPNGWTEVRWIGGVIEITEHDP